MQCPVCTTPDAAHYLCVDGSDYFLCSSCRAIFVDPAALLSKEKEQERYLLHENNPDDPGYRRFLERLALPLLKEIPPASSGLDYGCGPTPLLAQIIREHGHRAVVYDPYFFPDASVLTERYDFITCSEAAEHFYAPAAEFERLSTMLKPGGILALMTSLWDDSVDFATWYYRKDPTHVVFYHEETFRFLADRLGFSCTFPAQNIILMHKNKMENF